MEQLAVPQRLGDAVDEVEPGHLLVPDLGVEPDHVGVLQRADEGQGVADGGEQDVAAGLVGLGLDREPEAVAPVEHVLAEEVEALLVAVEGHPDVLGGVGLGPLAAAPEHVGVGAQLGRQVEVAHDLADRVAAHVAVVGGERPVAEHRVGEGVGGGHGDHQAGLLQGLPEPLDVPLPLVAVGAEGDQVVVVEGDAVGAQLGQAVDRLHRVQRRPGGVAEGVPGRPAHGPQAEAELVLSGGAGLIHGRLLA